MKKCGFTIFELLIAIVIIDILLALIILHWTQLARPRRHYRQYLESRRRPIPLMIRWQQTKLKQRQVRQRQALRQHLHQPQIQRRQPVATGRTG